MSNNSSDDKYAETRQLDIQELHLMQPKLSFVEHLSNEQKQELANYMYGFATSVYDKGFTRALANSQTEPTKQANYTLADDKLEPTIADEDFSRTKMKRLAPSLDNIIISEDNKVNISELIPYIQNMSITPEELRTLLAHCQVRAKETRDAVLFSLAGDYDLLITEGRVHLVDLVRSYIPPKVVKLEDEEGQ